MVASKFTNDSTLKNVHWALATGIFGKRDVNRIEREFLEVIAWELNFTQQDILAHHSAIVNIYYTLSKQPSNASPLTSQSSSSPPPRYSPPKDTATPIRKSTTTYDLSVPPPLLYPVALATQPFLKAGEARHSNSRSSNFSGFPIPWHGKTHSMPGQHTLPRISV